MKILLVNHYAGSPELGMEFRPYYFAKKWQKCGFDVGVHGVEIDDIGKIKKEFEDFSKISGLNSFGIKKLFFYIL